MTDAPSAIAPGRSGPDKAADLLSAHLERELTLCTSLLVAGEQKRDAIVANNLADITKAADREQRLVADLARLRTIRLRLVNGLTLAAGLPVGTKGRLLVSALSEHRPELTDQHDRLLDLAQRTEAVNLGNQSLLRHCLAVVEGVLDAITGTKRDPVAYGPKGGRIGSGGVVNLSI
jgi:flagellar biosynthesis/type III secretory pathway chaperone